MPEPTDDALPSPAPSALAEDAPLFPQFKEISINNRAATAPFSSKILVLLAVPLTAAAVGGLWHAVAYVLDFLIAFPAIAGSITATSMGNVVRWTRVSKSSSLANWAILASIPLTLVFRYLWDAVSTRAAIVADTCSDLMDKNPALSRAAAFHAAEQMITPWETFRLYMGAASHVGLALVSYHDGVPGPSNPIIFRGPFFWAVLLFEALIMVIFGVLAYGSQSSKRRCSSCGRTMEARLLFRRSGDLADSVCDLARAQEWSRLAALPKNVRSSDRDYVEANLLQCSSCGRSLLFVEASGGKPIRRMLTGEISKASADAARTASINEPI